MPARRPRARPVLSTIRLSGPRVSVSTTAAARKARGLVQSEHGARCYAATLAAMFTRADLLALAAILMWASLAALGAAGHVPPFF